MVEQSRAWHAIIAFRQHTQSNEVGHGKIALPLDRIYSQTTPLIEHTIGQPRTWRAIIILGKHKPSNDVGHGLPTSPLDCTHCQTTSGVECHSSTHGKTTLGVACHQPPWIAHEDGRCWAWHSIIPFGKHTRSDDVGHDIPSPLDCTHVSTTSGVECQSRP
uniref:Uncharacterized protein n=1 Tax=Solanum lycopersicum TaxID=4081 RepID=A0A3Q7EWV3_SOLLC